MMHIYIHLNMDEETDCVGKQFPNLGITYKNVSYTGERQNVMYRKNNNQKWVPLRAMKTFIRKKMGHTT